METEHRNLELKQIIYDIENEIRRLLEENTRLRNQVRELSQSAVHSSTKDKVVLLEEEVKKLYRIIEDLRNQESINRDKIFQIHKLLRQEIDKKASTSKEATWFDPNLATKNFEESSFSKEEPKLQEKNFDQGEVEYSPYIGIDEDEPITHSPAIDENLDIQKDKEVEVDVSHKQKTPDYPIKENKEKINNPDVVETKTNKLDQEKEITQPPTTPNKVYTETPKSSTDENSRSFLINNFEDEKDPFGDENSKIEDDDFFKSNKS